MSLWYRLQELVIEMALRLARVVIATVLGGLIYFVLTNAAAAPGSVQLALESWLAGALVLLLLESNIF